MSAFSFRNVGNAGAIASGGTASFDARICIPFLALDKSVAWPGAGSNYPMGFLPQQLVDAWFNIQKWDLTTPLGVNTLDVTMRTGTGSPCNMVDPQVREALVSPTAIQSNSGSPQFQFSVPGVPQASVDLAFNSGIYSDPTTDLLYYPYVNCVLNDGVNSSGSNALAFPGSPTGVLFVLGAQCPLFAGAGTGVVGNVTLTPNTRWY